MLFIGDSVIFSDELGLFNILKGIEANKVLQFFGNPEEYGDFFSRSAYHKYRLLIRSKEELKEFLDFFKNCPLNKNECITIKRHEMTLKETFETIKEYETCDFINRIYVEQLDKNEWINYECFKKIYKFLKDFDDLLPKNPSELDIIINAYDYVKKNPYVREKDDKSLSSKLFSQSILTGYRVCAGFTKQFNAILKEYGIQCHEYKYAQKGKESHIVSTVNIKDLGVYFFDITRDCFVEEHLKDQLKNETKYSGFMLSILDFPKDSIIIDNYDKDIYSPLKALELREKRANQNIGSENDKEIDFIKKNNEKLSGKLKILINTNFELFKDENFFDEVLDSTEIIKSKIYYALQIMNRNFGTNITDDFFIDALIKSKRNSDFKENKLFYQKAVISKFVGDSSINLSDAMTKINKKIK